MEDSMMHLHANEVVLSTQAFLILCRLYDSFYDELRQHEQLNEVAEKTAAVLLDGVEALKEQTQPPKQVVMALDFSSLFLVKKLVEQAYREVSEVPEQAKALGWLEECIQAMNKGMITH
ncbi:hypothetical protein [Brevibacillus laterosporus]|uniref:hypothetical protein n=1 Tax=Brevibacillus laterosporus TaxID=1465 RepID=UPI00264EFADE|nr:hypothetical protein [Brevibacillus laterosporus]MDN9009676.1 hypothetical protein [Brevibacillus laterosporus]MDO0940325.1 hypothetical protein [Brevibacillus laterosporus]